MFKSLKKKKENKVVSPLDGVAVELSKVPDEAFSGKMLGDGFAVAPVKGDIYSPVSGTVTDITDTKHAFCITADDGAEILLHIGINTVNLKGVGVSVFIKEWTKVTQGERIAEVDLDLLKKHELCIETPVLICNQDKFEITSTSEGDLKGGKDTLFTYKKIQKER